MKVRREYTAGFITLVVETENERKTVSVLNGNQFVAFPTKDAVLHYFDKTISDLESLKEILEKA